MRHPGLVILVLRLKSSTSPGMGTAEGRGVHLLKLVPRTVVRTCCLAASHIYRVSIYRNTVKEWWVTVPTVPASDLVRPSPAWLPWICLRATDTQTHSPFFFPPPLLSAQGVVRREGISGLPCGWLPVGSPTGDPGRGSVGQRWARPGCWFPWLPLVGSPVVSGVCHLQVALSL